MTAIWKNGVRSLSDKHCRKVIGINYQIEERLGMMNISGVSASDRGHVCPFSPVPVMPFQAVSSPRKQHLIVHLTTFQYREEGIRIFCVAIETITINIPMR